jgi:polyphenol oxidase
MTAIQVLRPEWSAAPSVHAAFTLRDGGVSAAPYATLNVGVHVGDAPAAVAENRRRVRAALNLPSEPVWIEQVHGTGVCDLDRAASSERLEADAVVTTQAGRVCVVQVADCLPILLATRDGSMVGAAHAGWRGLAAGILEAVVRRFSVPARDIIAWIGPGIGQSCFEVGAEVRAAFEAHDSVAKSAFTPNSRGRYQCDLVALARQRLTAMDVDAVFGGRWCTYSDAARFFSHRRDGPSGRMAALVWCESP